MGRVFLRSGAGSLRALSQTKKAKPSPQHALSASSSAMLSSLLTKPLEVDQGVLLCVSRASPRLCAAAAAHVHTEKQHNLTSTPKNNTTRKHPSLFPRSCSKKGFRDGPRLLLNCEEVKVVRCSLLSALPRAAPPRSRLSRVKALFARRAAPTQAPDFMRRAAF